MIIHRWVSAREDYLQHPALFWSGGAIGRIALYIRPVLHHRGIEYIRGLGPNYIPPKGDDYEVES